MLRLPARVIVLALLLHAGCPAGSAAGEETPAPANPSPPLAVTVDHGLVSVDVHDALLADVLHAVGEQAAVQVTIHSGVTAHVTESFVGVGLDEAIRRLASGYDVVLIYGSANGRGGAGRLAEVRVYEASTPAAPPVVDPGQRNARLQAMRTLIGQASQHHPEALASLAAMLAGDPDPVVRRSVAASFARFRGPEVMAALTSALGDQDASVRTSAVSSLGQMRDETSAAAVAQMLARDPDAGVRRAAVWALVNLQSEDAHRGLEAAASDPDTTVRQAAVAALARWERRTQPSAH